MRIIEKGLSTIIRSLYFIPGMYLFARPLQKFFANKYKKDKSNAIRTINFDGNKIKVNISSYIGGLIYWRGSHEWAPLLVVRRFLKPGMVFIDVGANQGEFTLAAAKRVQPDGKVLSFEPLSELYSQLSENVNLNNYKNIVTTYKLGLSSDRGTAKLFTSKDTVLHGAEHEGLPSMYATDYRNVALSTIDLEKLDDIISNSNIEKVDLIKIDVEGAELFVLRGAIDTLEKFKPDIIMEFNKETFEAAGYHQKDVLELLEKLNYKFYNIGLRGKKTKLNRENLPEYTNILCKIE